MKHMLWLLSALIIFSCTSVPEDQNMYLPVDKRDEGLSAWVGDSVAVRVLADGFEWSEGPLWLEEQQMLLFSDVPENTVYAWSEENGLTSYLSPSGYTGKQERGGEMGSNGLTLDNEGNLVLCQHGDRRVARMNAPLTDPRPDFETLAGRYEGMRFNSPNDVVISSDGVVYFTDPPYGLEKQTGDPARETPFQGVYRILTDGTVQLLTDTLDRPNGIALSPDEQTLYVGSSFGEKPWWMAYSLSGDSLSDGRILVDAAAHYEGARGPDGMTVMADGTIISSGYGGVWFIRPDGTVLGRILIDRPVSNVTADKAGRNIYVTADDRVLRIPLLSP